MEVRVVTGSNKDKKSKKTFVSFTRGQKLENKNLRLQFKKDNIVFVEKDDEGKLQIKEYHAYCDLMRYLDKINRENEVNKSLLINKFTNFFNLNSDYHSNDKEIQIVQSIQNNNKRIRENLQSIYECISLNANMYDKLIIGLGNQSVFETDITLHHTYGIPYIQGQAIKGMFRNYIMQEYFKKCSNGCEKECQKECEKEALKHQGFSLLFGGQNSNGENVQGKVIFMDSFPSGSFNIKKDVMAIHHMNYYSEGKLPLDTDETKPIFFLSLEKLSFEINIAIDKSICDIKWDERNEKMRDFIIENLIDALNFHGIGAKTAVGYGYFDIDKEQIKSELINEKNKKLREEECLKKRLQEDYMYKEATKNMTQFQIELYKIDKLTDNVKKNEKIMKLYNEKIDLLLGIEQRELAEFIREHLQTIGKWEYKCGKNRKNDKMSLRIEKICDILNIDVPRK